MKLRLLLQPEQQQAQSLTTKFNLNNIFNQFCGMIIRIKNRAENIQIDLKIITNFVIFFSFFSKRQIDIILFSSGIESMNQIRNIPSLYFAYA